MGCAGISVGAPCSRLGRSAPRAAHLLATSAPVYRDRGAHSRSAHGIRLSFRGPDAPTPRRRSRRSRKPPCTLATTRKRPVSSSNGLPPTSNRLYSSGSRSFHRAARSACASGDQVGISRACRRFRDLFVWIGHSGYVTRADLVRAHRHPSPALIWGALVVAALAYAAG